MFFDIRQNEESARNYTTTILKRKNEGISKMADNRVIIFDTTLRDGVQAAGVICSHEDGCFLARGNQ